MAYLREFFEIIAAHPIGAIFSAAFVLALLGKC
jgi:hypothetical protein